jgi:hypothetical protein
VDEPALTISPVTASGAYIANGSTVGTTVGISVGAEVGAITGFSVGVAEPPPPVGDEQAVNTSTATSRTNMETYRFLRIFLFSFCFHRNLIKVVLMTRE